MTRLPRRLRAQIAARQSVSARRYANVLDDDGDPISSVLSDEVVDTIHRVVAEKTREGIDPDELMAKLPLVDTLRDAAEPIYEGLRRGLPDLIRYMRGGDEAIGEALDGVWGPPDRLFRATSYLSYELARTVLRDVPPKRGPKLLALLGLHGRALRTAAEVRLLAMNGFEAGARARWRSLHELIVVAFVIHEADEAVAQRYMDYALIEVRDDLMHFAKHAEALGEHRPTERDLRLAEQLATDVIAEHGDEIKWSNGWAKPLFPNTPRERRVSFADLERYVGMTHLRPYYRLGNHHVHAGSWAANLNLAQEPGEAPKVTIGATVLADIGSVCHGALVAMMQVTTVLITEAFASVDTPRHFAELIVGMKCLENFAEDASELYAAASVRARDRDWITGDMTAAPPVTFVIDDEGPGVDGEPTP